MEIVGTEWFLCLAVGTSSILISTGWAETWIRATGFSRRNINLILWATWGLYVLSEPVSRFAALGCLTVVALSVLCSERSLSRIALALSAIFLVMAVQILLAEFLPYEFIGFSPRMRTVYLYPFAIVLTAMAVTWNPRMTVAVTICGTILREFATVWNLYEGGQNVSFDSGMTVALIVWSLLLSVIAYSTVVHVKKALFAMFHKIRLFQQSHEERSIG